MTENTSLASFSRRDLLKGGALVIGFSMAGLPAAAQAPAQAARGAVAGPPDPWHMDTWIAIHADNTATIFFGKGEFGQGNATGMLQVAGEELDLAMHQMRAAQLDTHVTPNQGGTTSSSTIHRGAPHLRLAAAEARTFLLNRAGQILGVQPGSLTVKDGVVSIFGETGGRTITYGKVVGDKPFGIKFTGAATPKAPSRYRLVGTRVPRIDIPDKAAGKQLHMQHVRVPGMWHGRVVLPRGQRMYGSGAKPVSVDEASLAGIPGARLVRKGDFLGVVAENEWDAVKAARTLKVTWAEPPALPGHVDLFDKMRKDKSTDTVIADWGDAAAGFAKAAHVREAAYKCPYQGHMPFGPNCAIADVKADSAVVMSSTQDVYWARDQLATVLGMPKEKVRVKYHEGSGTFGRSCYEDAGQAAAIMSQATGRPVRVQFMRWDEHGWDNYGPAHLAEVKAGVDAEGRLVAYEYHGWQHGWTLTTSVQDLAQQKTGDEWTKGPQSIPVNPMSTGSMYRVANRKVISHAVPMTNYLRGAPLRSPLDLCFSFASEQTMDELATAAKMDPLEFRLKNIVDPRWRDVLEAAAKAADWKPRVMGSSLSRAEVVTGRGLALGTHHVSYGAAVADIEVNKRTGLIVAKKLFAAMDCGLIVNPELVENQMVGQMIQSTSRVLKEEVTFDKTGVTSLDWQSYPILRFAEHPEVTAVVVQRMEEPSTGAGEEVMGATAAAIANAFFDATGVRLRQFPMTPVRVKAALANAPA